jgi:hypothetical protein
MENCSNSLRTLTATITVKSEDQTMGTVRIIEGKLWFQNSDDTTGRNFMAKMVFERHNIDNSAGSMHEEFVLADGWLCDRDYEKKTQNRYQLPREKVDLFDFEASPYPLPIRQPSARIHEKFDVQLAGDNADDPPNTAHLHMTPKAGTHLAKRFATIELWIDSTTHLPVRVVAFQKDGSAQTIQLTNIMTDQSISSDVFRLPPIKGWEEHDEPYEK